MHRGAERGYRPAVTLPTVASAAIAAAADARQAAYFHGYVVEQRHLALNEIGKRNTEITRRIHAGHPSAIGRLRTQIRSVEAEVRHLERLTRRLERRFSLDAARPN
jgi:hypothetical protein